MFLARNPILVRCKLIILVKKVKISNQTLWAKRKIGSLKTFHFPHLKYQFPKGGEQNHPSVKKETYIQIES